MVFVFLAEGCEEIEALTPVDILRRGGVEVTTVGIGGRSICSSHGVTILADISDREMELGSQLEGIVLPGGMPGTTNLLESETVAAAISFCLERELLIGAICAAPTVLKARGALEGRVATAHPSFSHKLEQNFADAQVVKDGRIITGRAMGASNRFSLLLLETLKDRDTADKVAKAICYEDSGEVRKDG